MRAESETRPQRPQSALLQITEDLGPGLITGAADDDPSGIATYSQAGAQFGYGLLWTMLFSYPLMATVQLVSAHIGRVTGAGLASNFTRCFPQPIVRLLVGGLLLANIFNIGADLAAMSASLELVAVGARVHVSTVLFALICLILQVFVPYRRYSSVLKWLTLSLFAYVGVLLLVHIDWPRALLGLIWPRHLGKSELLTVVAVLGTTISPYLFFWQSSQEAEEVATTDGEGPLIRRPLHVSKEFRRIGFDTWLGMAFSNFVALAIMLATAATLHANGKTDIATAADAAEALRPIAGPFASLLFAVGIIGTGLLAVPVLAGSAAFAFAESHGWKTGLEYKPHEAKRFYTVIVAATVLGVVLDWSNLDPIKALIYSAVLNGVVAVPIMGAMMIVGSSRKIMGHLHEHWDVIVVGWVATLVMAAASIGMFWDMLT